MSVLLEAENGRLGDVSVERWAFQARSGSDIAGQNGLSHAGTASRGGFYDRKASVTLRSYRIGGDAEVLSVYVGCNLAATWVNRDL